MKKHIAFVFLFIPHLLMAQHLDSLWKEIDSTFEQGNLRSVQPRVKEAIALAKAQNKTPYLVKGLFYNGMITLTTAVDEDDVNPVFESFREESEAAHGADKSILQIYSARLYQLYFDENRYRIIRRTNLENSTSDDVRYWTETAFRNKIKDLYTEVLAQQDLLLNEPSSRWSGLFTLPQDTARYFALTPTLYDAFSHYYIAYLRESGETAEDEIGALAALQQQRGEINAFLYTRSLALSNRPTAELESLAAEYPREWYTGELYKQLAATYLGEGRSERSSDAFRKVLELEEKTRAAFPGSEAEKAVTSLANEVRSSSFSVEIEKYIPEKENTPFRIAHRNLDTVYVRIFDYNTGLKDPNLRWAARQLNNQYQDSEERYTAFLKAHQVIQEYPVALQSFDDYLEHSSLFLLRPLPKGRYLVLFSQDPEFRFREDAGLKFSALHVSDAAVEFDGTFRVTDRRSGQPLKGRKIEVYTYSFDYSTEQETTTLVKTLTTDALGQVPYAGQRQFIYRLQGESVFYGENLYHPGAIPKSGEREIVSTDIFTDRAIYRPGQTVYFKAIATSSFRKEVKVLPRRDLTVTLRDANRKELSTLTLKTNDFGSVHGEFPLPASALTGNFSIETSLHGQYYFRVEEYKRPKFRVNLEMPRETYTLNDTVRVPGRAEAFSGAQVDHAAVEYRVFRQAIYPFRYSSRLPFEPEEQVAFGTTETDKDGRFALHFKAIPARKQKDSSDIRTYMYRVEAAVTDLNGETQTGSGTVKVGDKKMLLSAQIGEEADVSALDDLKILTTNLNDQPVESRGTVRIFKLKPPARVLRKAQYTTDYQFYSPKEFAKLFPHEPYADEDRPQNWEKGDPVFNGTFDTGQNQGISVKNAGLLAKGHYLIVLRNEDGTENTQRVYLRNEKKPGKPTDIFSLRLDKKTYAPGETARLVLNTSASNLYVYLRTEADEELLKEKVVRLKGKAHTLEIPVKENYLGGVWVHYTYTLFNRSERGSIRLEVPFDHKKLHITTAVTRDKLTPGAKEKWSFTVTGSTRDQVLAEVLTGMYDASLDQFAPHSFARFPYSFYTGARYGYGYRTYAFVSAPAGEILGRSYTSYTGQTYAAPPLNTYDFSFVMRNGVVVTGYGVQRKSMRTGAVMEAMPAPSYAEDAAQSLEMKSDEASAEEARPETVVQPRKALQETAFFFPDLKTDKEGNVTFEFTVPESLTEWKLMAFAHTPDMKTGYFESRLKTSKDLMVIPNVPRFLREGDEVRISTKIVNLSAGVLNGSARLFLLDALTHEPVDALFGNASSGRNFTAAKGASGEVSWTLKIPENIPAVTYRVVASAGDFSDGEEAVLPVVSNRMLVTETMPIYIRENQNKTFNQLLQNQSATQENFQLTLEMTTNPIWYAIFSLPYLREYPYECSEQIFSRLYGNLISESIMTSQPKIKAVFDDWNRKGQLKSKLELNQELKNILLEETPWVRDAVSEEEQMKRIAVLFDLNKMQQEMKESFDLLRRKQAASGGFPWFDGGVENQFITTHIVSGFGHLKKMKIDFGKYGIDLSKLAEKALTYIDQKQLEYYREQKRLMKNELDWNTGVHYLYARSFFLQEHPLPKTLDSLKLIYLDNIRKNTNDLSLQAQAMAALVLLRFGEKKEAEKILTAVNERSVDSDEMGKYWKNNLSGWYWYQAPVETQALLIEAFDEVLKDEASVEAMKVWLLKNRQTHQWSSTKATTKAVYALLNTGKNWTDAEKGVSLTMGGQPIDLNTPSAQTGSGYVKKTWSASEIQPEMGRVEVRKTSPGVAWGAMYWQYFEDLDKITSSETGIAFRKKLYLKKNTESGPVLREITENTPIAVGDLVTVRLEISTDRAMEFVHIKDMRASGFEPVNVLSGYRWQEGFGYYESTRDLATNFFADRMPKGTYVFEYNLRANNAGNFSNGITQMQNMYAPELSAHSEGIRVEIR